MIVGSLVNLKSVTPAPTKTCVRMSVHICTTLSVSNYRSFDFFYLKFDHSSYSKNYAKYNFFFVVDCFINTRSSRMI